MTPFELEKNDTFKLKAVIEPSASEIGDYLTWSGDGVNGTGIIKDFKYSETGVKNVKVSVSGYCPIEVKIGVNDNANSLMRDFAMDITNSKWAHVGSEQVVLKASATDLDWFVGVKSDENRIDIEQTKWVASHGTMIVNRGETGIWKPNEKGEATITTRFKDKQSLYAPRNETVIGNEASIQTKVGAFIVCVSTEIASSNGNKSNKIYEDGTFTGEAMPINLDGIFNESLKVEANGNNKQDEAKNVDKFVSTNLTFLCDPPEAEMRGKISCDVSTILAGTMSYILYDSDPWDGSVQFSLSVGLPLPGGVGFSVDFPIELGGDNCEASVFLAYGFSSTDLGNKNPQDANLMKTSAELYDPWLLSNYFTDSKPMTHSASATITKAKNGAESKAMYQAFVTAQAHATNDYCTGTATIKNSKIDIDVKNVRYANE